MKYTKSIIVFLLFNLILIFLTIFIANKARVIEKNNVNLKKEIFKMNQNIKINKIELLTYKNSSNLTKLYSLYFKKPHHNKSNIISLNNISKENQNIKLVNKIN